MADTDSLAVISSMKYCIPFFLLTLIAASCSSVESHRITFLEPKPVRLGGTLVDVSAMLNLDTAAYRIISSNAHIKGQYLQFSKKRYSLLVDNLKAITLDDNLYDSVELFFIEDLLYSVSFYLSNNQKIEILKFQLYPRNKSLAGDVTFRQVDRHQSDTSFRSAGYRELTYSYSKKRISFFYREDILDNIAVLDIQNLKMEKLFRRNRLRK